MLKRRLYRVINLARAATPVLIGFLVCTIWTERGIANRVGDVISNVIGLSFQTNAPLYKELYQLGRARVLYDSPRISSTVKEVSQRIGIESELVHAVIMAESGFNPNAVSSAGASGLMQLMPGTASDMGVLNPFDVQQNIEGGTKYLSKLIRMFNGNIELALAAYNAGPNAVKQSGGIPPFPETQAYVKKVMNNYKRIKAIGT